MKKLLSTISFAALLMQSVVVSAETVTFSDVAGYDYQESIERLAGLGVLNGYDNGDFRPDQPVNRAEFSKVIVEALGAEGAEGGCFNDVNSQWYAAYVCEAKDLGVVKGYGDGFYRPGQEINMVEAFKIALQAYEMPVGEAADGAQWYQPYADFVHNNNMFSKYSYFPQSSITRGEVALLIDTVLRIKNGELGISTERQVLSAGCGNPAPGAALSHFTGGGISRNAITHVPSNYDPNRPMALIVAYHGRTSPNWEVRQYYELEKAAGDQAIYIYPAGAASGSAHTWSSKDYELFETIVDDMAEAYCIDMDEIYAIGHSLGAWFVNSLACAKGDILRGVGTLGGSRAQSECSGPVAVMQWHNPNDRLAAFSGGEAARDNYLEQNQCGQQSNPVEPGWGSCVQYQGCYEHAPTVWCPHTNNHSPWNGSYYPHNWPRNTGQAMWDFLRAL